MIYKIGMFAVLCVIVANLVEHPGFILLILLAIGTGCVVVMRPDLGAWLVVILTPIETAGPLGFAATKAAKLGLTTLVALTLLAGVVKQPRAQSDDPYRWPFLLLLTSGWFASIIAGSPFASLGGLASLLIYVLFCESLRCSKVFVESGPKILRTVVWSALPVAILCIAQLTWGYGGMLGSGEQQAVEAEGQVSTIWPSIERASGLFNGPTAAGAFLALAAVIVAGHIMVFRKFRIAYALLASVCLAGVLATFSRGAILGCLTGVAFSTCLAGFLTRRRIVLFSLATALAVGALFADEGVRGYLRIGTDLVSVSPSRFEAWNAAFVMIRQHPVFGIGFYEFRGLSQGIEGFVDTPVHPHNGFLKALVEQGPIGAVGYLLFPFIFLRTARKGLRVAGSLENKWILTAIAGVGICLFTQELFDAGLVLGGSSIAILFAIMLGLQTSLCAQRMGQTELVGNPVAITEPGPNLLSLSHGAAES